MIHRFHTEFAKKYGLPEAVILEYFIHWISQNEAGGRPENFRDGRWWAFNTVKKIGDSFEYLSEWQVRKSLDNLVAKGALIAGNYNQRGFDRTKWYALGDEVIDDLRKSSNGIAENHKWNCGNPQMELRNTTNPFVGNHNAIPIKGPIIEPIIEPITSNAREGNWAGEGIALFERSFGFLNEKAALGIEELSRSVDWPAYEKAVGKAHRLYMQSKLPKGRVLAYVLSAAEGIGAGNDYDNRPKGKNDVLGAAEELERRLEGGEDNGNDSADSSDSIWGVWGSG